MNLTEVSKKEALQILKTDVDNSIWVMRVLPNGPVDLLPLRWTDWYSSIFTEDYFINNKHTRYFKADTNIVEEIAPVVKEIKRELDSRTDPKLKEGQTSLF